MIPSDYRFIAKTRDGYQILAIYQDRFRYLNIAAYMPRRNKYFIGRAYDPTTGQWVGGGSYNYDTLAEAEQAILRGHDGPYTRFDVHNPADVDFEYDGQYNWNHVDTEWLKRQDHRRPGFSTMEHSDFDYYSKHGYDPYGEGNLKTYPYTEEGFRQMKRDYRMANSPKRSRNEESGKRTYHKGLSRTIGALVLPNGGKASKKGAAVKRNTTRRAGGQRR